jgi:hypothetical protein
VAAIVHPDACDTTPRVSNFAIAREEDVMFDVISHISREGAAMVGMLPQS